MIETTYFSEKEGLNDNVLYYAENLQILKSLQTELKEKVRCIYLDPPYNTKQKFTHYKDSLSSFSWIEMMRDRLVILRELLRQDGTIWISIDDNECHYLKVLCDEIFGRKNFVANVIWEKKCSVQNDAKWLSDSHDHVLVYAKCIDLKRWGKDIKRGLNLLPRTEAMDARYKNLDSDPRGRWNSDSLSVKTYSARCDYPIRTPSGRTVKPPSNRSWRFSEDKFKELVKDNRIWFGFQGNNVPMIKLFLSKVQDGVVCKSIWTRKEVGDTTIAKKETLKLNNCEVFDTPKPEKLIQRILHLATDLNDLVLDCFAGSGTTGAVAHKMGRRWIMIENGKQAKTHIIPRLQKVIQGLDLGGITKIVNWQGGGGFKVCELTNKKEDNENS